MALQPSQGSICDSVKAHTLQQDGAPRDSAESEYNTAVCNMFVPLRYQLISISFVCRLCPSRAVEIFERRWSPSR
jgi:hypothetical protein